MLRWTLKEVSNIGNQAARLKAQKPLMPPALPCRPLNPRSGSNELANLGTDRILRLMEDEEHHCKSLQA